MDSDSAASEGGAPTDSRIERTRSALRQALLRNLQATAFEQVTVREITREAEVSYATFFRHYPDKEALLEALAAEQIGGVIERVLPLLFGEGAHAAAVALCATVEANRGLWSALLTGGAAATMREELVRQARRVAARRPLPESWLPRDLRIVNDAGGVLDVVAWWLQQDAGYPASRIAEILERLVFGPMVADGLRPA